MTAKVEWVLEFDPNETCWFTVELCATTPAYQSGLMSAVGTCSNCKHMFECVEKYPRVNRRKGEETIS